MQTTMRPCISSMGMCLTRPLMMVRGFSSPKSISSTYSASASGCLSALLMRPTMSEHRDTSIGPSAAMKAMCACVHPGGWVGACACMYWVIQCVSANDGGLSALLMRPQMTAHRDTSMGL